MRTSEIKVCFRLLLFLLLLYIAGCSKTGPSGSNDRELVIPGTGASEVILNAIAAEFNKRNPGMTVIIPSSTGSSGGVRSAGNGEALIGRVSRKLKPGEESYGLTYLPFAIDAVVFAVSGNVKINGLSSRELVDIFSGKISNWKDAGWKDGNIYVFMREPGDSSLTVIRDNIKDFRNINFAKDARIQYRDYEMLNMLNKYKNGIGFITKSSLIFSQNVRTLVIDGVAPNDLNIQNGMYRLVSEYALVYRKRKLNRLAGSFIDFLFSEEAGKILKSHGIIQLKR